MTVGERIKKRRKQLKLTADDVAVKIGKNRATVYRYESDEVEGLALDTILNLAKALNTDPAYLMGWSDEEPTNLITEYDYYNTNISAGLPVNVDGITHCETISIPDAVMGKHAGNKDTFILRVNGDSMNKIIPDGSLIAVKPTSLETLKNGDMVVFSEEHKYSVKSYFKTSDTLIFKPNSTNNNHHDQTHKLDTDITIHGKVVLYIVELD